MADRGPHAESATSAAAARPKRRWPKIVAISTLVGALVLAAAGAGGYALLKRLEGNVTTIAGVQTEQVDVRYEPLTVLVMGSDSRDGANASWGTDGGLIEGERSDTTMLVHISADRSRALGVSIPRDLLTTLPECASGGDYRPYAKFNTAFSGGGAACTAEAVEELSGIRINHAVVVDFQGFKDVVDAMGGVSICLEEATYDPLSRLDLPAGWSTVQGDQALAFVRTRSGLGDGSDISRIKRQQQFLAAALQQATDRELLRNPVKLYRMLDAATSSLSVDEGLNELGEMRTVAESLIGLEPKDVTFVTLPFVDAMDGSNVLLDEARATEIWSAIENDTAYPPPPTIGPDGRPLSVKPDAFTVNVLNGVGRENAATSTAADLRSVGFVTGLIDIANRPTYTVTRIVHNPADADAARTLQAAVPGSQVREDPQAAPGSVTLIVGADYTGTEQVIVRRPGKPGGSGVDPDLVTGDTQVCAS